MIFFVLFVSFCFCFFVFFCLFVFVFVCLFVFYVLSFFVFVFVWGGGGYSRDRIDVNLPLHNMLRSLVGCFLVILRFSAMKMTVALF